MSGKHYKRNKKQKSNNLFITLLLFIFISIMVISSIKIVKWLMENKKNKDTIKDIENAVFIDNNIDNIDKYDVDFKSLKQKNSDTIAWIKVNGTDIEYPVVKTTNNDYYLTHSFDKSYNTAGWVFMNCNNKFDGTDNNIVIFAHNRMDGSMFGTLKNVLTSDWQNNKDNYIIPFITENEKEEYEVFSAYKIENEDYYITTNFKNDTEFQEFINKITSRSVKSFGTKVTTNDQILTLSTCAADNRYRVVVHAKKIK